MKILTRFAKKGGKFFAVQLTILSMVLNTAYPALTAYALDAADDKLAAEQVEDQTQSDPEEQPQEKEEDPANQEGDIQNNAPEQSSDEETETETKEDPADNLQVGAPEKTAEAPSNDDPETNSTEIPGSEISQGEGMGEGTNVGMAGETPEETPEVSEQKPEWQLSDGGKKAEIGPVELDETYVAPQNDKVTVTFTKLPEKPGNLVIEEIILSDEQVKQLGALSNVAYDITSDMKDGTFEYDLTLPKPDGVDNAQVKYAEDEEDLDNAETVEKADFKGDEVKVEDLDHFTIYVLTVPKPDNTQEVLINEFLVNSVGGANEWVELYNNTDSDIDISGWKIFDGNSDLTDDIEIPNSTTILARKVMIFRHSDSWLNDGKPETITLKDDEGAEIDSVKINDSDTDGIEIDHYPNEGETVRRTTDGGNDWEVNNVIYVNAGYSGDEFGTEEYPFNTIQEGINAAAEGGTVEVAAGTYAENLTVDKKLILQGDSKLSVVEGQVTVNSDDVTIDGFKITNNNLSGTGIYSADHSNITISNNLLTEIGNNSDDSVGRGIVMVSSSSAVDNIEISNNEVNNIVSGKRTGGNSTSSSAISIGWTSGTEDITNLVIKDNIISDIDADTSPWLSDTKGQGAYGILINHGTSGGQTIAPEISDNQISNLEGLWAHAIGLEGDTPDATVVGNAINSVVDHKESAGHDAAGIMFEDNPSVSSVTISNNTFSNVFWDIIDASSTNTVYVDASWGGEDFVGVEDGKAFKYDKNAFSSIQDGIDAVAENGTVEVAAGTYEEENQIVIDKNLSIVGESKENVVIKPNYDTSTGTYSETSGWFYVKSGSKFTLDGVTLDGNGKIINTAVQSRGEVDIRNCSIKNIYASKYIGFGIQILAGSDNKVTNCEFENINRVGIHVRGHVIDENPEAVITNCVYTGKGDVDALDYAVEFGGGGRGEVDGLTVSNNRGIASSDGSDSAGILATDYYGTGTEATIKNSTFENNSTGIYVGYASNDETYVKAEKNIFKNNDRNFANAGITQSNAEENWWGTDNAAEIANKISGDVDYDPWCMDDSCSTLSDSVYSENETAALSETPQDISVGGLTITGVTGTGNIFVAKYDGAPSSGGLNTGVDGFYYDIQYSDSVTFPINIEISYDDSFDENHFVSLYYYKDGAWHDYKLDSLGTTGYEASTVDIETENNKITASLQHLTPIVPGLDTTAPSVPTNGQPNNSYKTTNDFYFTWDASTDSSSVIYEFQSSGSSVVDGDGSLVGAWNSIDDGNSEQNNLTSPTIHSTGAPDGTYYWQVRAIDEFGNTSAWSEIWNVTIDTHAPAVPTHVSPDDGTHTTTANQTKVDWSDVSDPSTPVSYYYQSSRLAVTNPDGTFASPAHTSGALSASEIPTGGTPEGTYYWHVRAVDAAGNSSAWSSAWHIIVDNTSPTVDLVFSGTGSGVTSFQAVFNEDVNESEAENPANYFLHNWPGAGGSGNLDGHASVSYDSSSHIATVAFTTSGWFVSPEQEWGVENIHDLAGNVQSVNPYSETSTAMVAPTDPGTPASTPNPTNIFTQIWTWLTSTDTGGSGVKGYYQRIYDVLASSFIGDWAWIGNVLGVSTSLTDGEYQMQVKAEDNAGNFSGEVSSDALTVDSIKPSKPVITSPDDDAYFKTTPIKNEWTASVDSGSGIKEYRIEYIYEDGHTFSGGPYRTTTNTWRNHSPSIKEQGGVTIRVQALDNAGNYSDWSDPVHYHYDATAPAVPTGIYFKDTVNDKDVHCGELTSARNFDVYWDANTESDFDHYEYISFNADGSTGSIREFSTNYFNASWWTAPIEGTYGVQIRAVDKAGNKSEWFGGSQGIGNSCTYKTDWTKPTDPTVLGFKNPNLSCGAITNIKNITVDWSDSSDDNGIKGYNYSIDYPLASGSGRGSWSPFFAGTNSQYGGSLNEGIHYIKVQAVDNAGNTSAWSDVCSITYDSIAPEIPNLISPTDNAVVKGGSLTNEWSSVPDAVKYIYESWHNTDTSNLANRRREGTINAPATSKTATNVSDATFWWRVKAIDVAGNESGWSDLWKVTVDNTAPTLDHKTDFGTGWYNVAQTSTFYYTDDNMASGYTDPTCEINTEGAGQTCSIMPNICDKAGNCNTATQISNGANIDFADPTSVITYPAGDDEGVVYANDWNGTLAGTADDGLSGVQKVELRIQRDIDGVITYWNGADWQASETLVSATGTTSWTYGPLALPLAEGKYNIESHATDNAGNTENTYKLTIVFDKTIPTVDLAIDPKDPNGDNGWYVSKPTITLSANDKNLDKIEYQIGSKTGSWTTYAGPVEINDGQHVFYYRSLDKAGNYSDTGAKNVKVDTDSPDNVSGLDADWDEDKEEVQLSWDAKDADIYKVYIYRGGNKEFHVDNSRLVSENSRSEEGFDDDGREPGEKYYYKFVTRDEAGNSSDVKIISIRIPEEEGEEAVVTDEGTETLPQSAVIEGQSTEQPGTEEEVQVEGEEEIKPEISEQAEKTSEGEVAGEKIQCQAWPWWAWALVLAGFIVLLWNEFRRRYVKEKPVFASSIVVSLVAVIFWYYFDKCRENYWFLYGYLAALVIGFLVYVWLERQRAIQPKMDNQAGEK